MIVREGHPSLSVVCDPFNFETDDADKLVHLLRRDMLKENGLGLAAPQIDVRKRAFILKNGSGVLACFNPTIVYVLDGQERALEGCLSYPGIFLHVRRFRRVLVRFQNEHGLWVEHTFSDKARAYQHEMDHLDGRTLKDFVPAQALAIAKAKAKPVRV